MLTIRKARERNTHHGKLLEKRFFSRDSVVGLEYFRCFGGFFRELRINLAESITKQEEEKQQEAEPPSEMAQVRLGALQRAFETALKDDAHLTNIAGMKVNQMAARKPPVPQVMRCVGKEMA